MFFPLRDDNPSRGFPFITLTLIVINVMVYIVSIMAGQIEYIRDIYTFGLIPSELFHNDSISTVPNEMLPEGIGHIGVNRIPNFMTIFTSMFMHGGFAHLAGNMWFLWLFGDNVEDRMGGFRFLLFYLIAGVLAALAHALTAASSPIPMIGASGAISGVIGAYIVLFPTARIITLVWFFFLTTVEIPAIIYLGIWFLGQVYSGFSSFGAEGAGVAFFAHVGGFVAGAILVKLFVLRQYVESAPDQFYYDDMRNFSDPGNRYNDHQDGNKYRKRDSDQWRN